MKKVIKRRVYARQILRTLEPEELCFSKMLEVLPLTRGTLSTTLKEMGRVGLIKKIALGRNCYYHITNDGRRELVGAGEKVSIEEQMAEMLYRKLKTDMRVLRKQCGAFVRVLKDNKEISPPEIEKTAKLARHLL